MQYDSASDALVFMVPAIIQPRETVLMTMVMLALVIIMMKGTRKVWGCVWRG